MCCFSTVLYHISLDGIVVESAGSQPEDEIIPRRQQMDVGKKWISHILRTGNSFYELSLQDVMWAVNVSANHKVDICTKRGASFHIMCILTTFYIRRWRWRWKGRWCWSSSTTRMPADISRTFFKETSGRFQLFPLHESQMFLEDLGTITVVFLVTWNNFINCCFKLNHVLLRRTGWFLCLHLNCDEREIENSTSRYKSCSMTKRSVWAHLWFFAETPLS